MTGVNKTLYIPLYGKSYVSKKGIFLNDKKAEEIWEAEGFPLKGKARSKWLAYYMGIRCAVFDEWLKGKIENDKDAVIIHIGCGMDSRVIRTEAENRKWYDVDFPDVIKERKRYYNESDSYKMIGTDIRVCDWLTNIKENKSAVIVMEGVSMYLTATEMAGLADSLCNHFESLSLLVDCYTSFAAKMSKYKNPVNDVGVSTVYGTDNPESLQVNGLCYIGERDMTPERYVNELHGMERFIFKNLYAGGISKKLYRLFEYRLN